MLLPIRNKATSAAAAALALAIACVNSAFATDFLAPGIYRVEPDSHPSPPNRMLEAETSRFKERFEHALPKSADITYAVVSHEPGSGGNRVHFLVDKDYKTDVNSANKLCVAYAFPGWNDYSASQPFCRTNISNESEALLKQRTAVAFTVTWQPRKTYLSTETIRPQRKPTADEVGACALGVCSPEAYGKGVNHYEMAYYADSFALDRVRPYQTILYLTQAVPLFARAERDTILTRLDAGTYVPVLSTDAQWYEIERVGRDGSITHGWVDRDDAVAVNWVAQRARTRNFLFRVAFIEGELTSDSPHAVAIEIIDRKSGVRTQVIRDFDSDPGFAAPANALRVVDANFDGDPDISIFGMSGGAGPNSTENFFLFDAARRRFVFDETLSGLSQIAIDSRTRSISSAQRNSCCSHSAQTYRYAGGTLTLVSTWDESLTADGKWLETTIGRARNGKLHYQTRRTKPER
ncbi:XAC2610-related protein [Cupriavidus basilensis]|uniref:XAC2610-related protein n=1 Tax=Cupriavidus basilensis TaxID=68895 RepID=UPI0039F69FCA